MKRRDGPQHLKHSIKMKYAIFFTFLCCYLCYWMFNIDSGWRYQLIWPIVSSLILAVSYSLKQPRLILGKTEDGTYSTLLLIINLPWLSFSYLVWYLNILVSTEDFKNQIGHTNIYISRRPRLNELKEIYEVVIDLTAEFIEPKKEGQNYFHLPWLDGISPSTFKIPEGITTDSKILVHCAQGHGRSAIYTAMLLRQLKLCNSTAEAYHLILQSRPAAKASKQQLQYLIDN